MNAQCLKKLPKKYKTTQQFFAKKCNRRLKKVAQVVINRPIWSHCTPFYAKNTSSKSLLNVFSLSLSLSLLIAGPLVWNFLQSLMNLCSKTRRVCDINLQTENILDHLWRRGSLWRSFYMGHLRPLLFIFSLFQTNNFNNKSIWKMSIQYMVLGIKPTTLRTWVYTNYHYTRSLGHKQILE